MNELFPILALETSGTLCSVALYLDINKFIELNYLEKHVHSQKLIGMIDTVLKISDIELNKIKSIAVSMGPGSFTGLRIGLSAAKGIAFGAALPIIPVPTFDAFAHQIAEYLPDQSRFAIAVGANIEEAYFARYFKKGIKVEILEELKLIEKINLENLVASDEMVYGNFGKSTKLNVPDGPTAKAIGEWAYLYGQDLLTFDQDYLEPNYFKKFIVRAKK
ncbi:MAG: tRNA (adenosine(37)-N6)-threonylcarbamoyltransferase complex dimerization subunit type 1 TsaB [Ignavibacteriales bacterium]|nr:tRNA (adenosine(37)-N6)-threonylcarbamoyltransferase complex dimerization subunit type 1 TsaB [Ignavibacteriales bacterium]